jgi:hypothetical protein
LCGHPVGTNYITCSWCRLCRHVRTRLQVLALHWVFLHITRPTPRSRTRGPGPPYWHYDSPQGSGWTQPQP